MPKLFSTWTWAWPPATSTRSLRRGPACIATPYIRSGGPLVSLQIILYIRSLYYFLSVILELVMAVTSGLSVSPPYLDELQQPRSAWALSWPLVSGVVLFAWRPSVVGWLPYPSAPWHTP